MDMVFLSGGSENDFIQGPTSGRPGSWGSMGDRVPFLEKAATGMSSDCP